MNILFEEEVIFQDFGNIFLLHHLGITNREQ